MSVFPILLLIIQKNYYAQYTKCTCRVIHISSTATFRL